jgi:hypothetical protein
MSNTPELKRSINLPFLIFYGLGTMVAAGFFALMGKIAGEAGMFAPIAFLSAFSFAELPACPSARGNPDMCRKGSRGRGCRGWPAGW